jgi:hypothetical protein
VDITVSGSDEAGRIVLRNQPGETPILDGSGRVAAIVNAGNPMAHSVAGRALAQTYLCGRRK